jgi:UV DNA damage repair endonuclease
MYIHKKTGVPVVFDHAHYDYKPTKGIDINQAMKLAMSTWAPNRNPKVHVCSQAPGVKIHNHAENMKLNDFLKVYEALKQTGVKKCIMMLEVKNKDVAL